MKECDQDGHTEIPFKDGSVAIEALCNRYPNLLWEGIALSRTC